MLAFRQEFSLVKKGSKQSSTPFFINHLNQQNDLEYVHFLRLKQKL